MLEKSLKLKEKIYKKRLKLKKKKFYQGNKNSKKHKRLSQILMNKIKFP